MAFTADASITHDGRTITLTLAEQQACIGPGTDWIGPGDPSSWLSVAVYRAAREKCGGAVDPARALAAQALGIPVEKLVGAIEWHVNYMRWHDGDDSYDV